MRRLMLTLLLGLLVGCAVPPTMAELPADLRPSPSASAAPSKTDIPAATIVGDGTIASDQTVALATTEMPTATALPTLTITPTSAALPTNTPLPAMQGTGALVKGTISYPATPTLPPDALLTIKLMPGRPGFYYPDVSQPLGEQRISPVGPGAVPFGIEYDPAAINPMVPYTVFAELSAGGQRIFTGAAGVDTANNPANVAITLHGQPTATTVTGTVRYPADRQPPPGAVLTISLQKMIDGIGMSPVLGEQRVSPVGAAPIPFTIPVDPTKLDPYGSYYITAHLEAPGRIMWLAPQQMVLTYGNPATAELTLEPPANTALLSGLITLPDSFVLPPDAILTVQMTNLHNGTINSAQYGHQITTAGATPIPYTIEYFPENFISEGTYALYASVRLHEKLLFSSPLIPLDPSALPSTFDLSLQRPANPGIVRGTVRYTADQPLPPDAQLVVQLADMRSVGGDGWPEPVATQTISLTGTQPLSFAIEYDPVAITSGVRYAILAEIRAGDKVLLPSAWYEQDVITNGNPNEIEVVLK